MIARQCSTCPSKSFARVPVHRGRGSIEQYRRLNSINVEENRPFGEGNNEVPEGSEASSAATTTKGEGKEGRGRRGCRCTCVVAIALHRRDRDAYEVISSRWAQTSCRRGAFLRNGRRGETETRTGTGRLDGKIDGIARSDREISRGRRDGGIREGENGEKAEMRLDNIVTARGHATRTLYTFFVSRARVYELSRQQRMRTVINYFPFARLCACN